VRPGVRGIRLDVRELPALRDRTGLVAAPPSRGATYPARVLLVRAALILVMAVGSIAMWIAVPVAWLYLASRLSQGTQPTLGPFVMVLVGIPLSMVVIGKLLATLDRLYGRVTGTLAQVHIQMPWHKSMRGERGSTRPRSVLDIVMVISVSLALLLFGLWFFLIAGSSLPTG
jgi:hypothetical protein